jgi:hypothetical protein
VRRLGSVGSIVGLACGAIAAWWIVQACGTNTPTLPGQFLGSFLFTANLVVEAGPGQVTTCQVAIPLPDGGVTGGDGGVLFFATSPQFYAELSLLADAGQVVLQLTGTFGPDGGPLTDTGSVQGSGFTVVTSTEALVSGCGCTAGLTETISLAAGDAGLVPGLSFLSGTIVDRLEADAGLPLDAGPMCASDAGPGCELGCDLVYVVTGVPGQP